MFADVSIHSNSLFYVASFLKIKELPLALRLLIWKCTLTFNGVTFQSPTHTFETYPSVVETAFPAASANQSDRNMLSEDPWPMPSTRNAKPGYLTSNYLQHGNPVHQPNEKVRDPSLQFCPGGVNKQILLLSLPLKRITHETQTQRVAEFGREPRRSHRVPCSSLPKTRSRLTFALARLLILRGSEISFSL